MSIELFGCRVTPGNHVGEMPECETAQAELRRLHALGHDTVMALDYEKLIRAGIEPDSFKTLTRDDIRNLATPAVYEHESLV